MMNTHILYGHSRFYFDENSKASSVEIKCPSGVIERVPVFRSLDYVIYRDLHGYTAPVLREDHTPNLEARFSSYEEGVHSFRVLRQNGEEIAAGNFNAVDRGYSGYVGVSKNDSRYFAYEDGKCFVPIGVNLGSPKMDIAPNGLGHYRVGDCEMRTTGIREYRRIIRKMAENGANLLRLCIGSTIFDARTETPEVYDHGAFAVLDAVVEECRAQGVKVMLTFEACRSFCAVAGIDPNKVSRRRDRKTGQPITDIAAYLRSPFYRNEWLRDLRGYIYRYGNDPTIFAFELWDEMDLVKGIGIDDVADFTEYCVSIIKRSMPKTMVVNSLSPFDDDAKLPNYQQLSSSGVDFDQVHRYFDLSAISNDCSSEVQNMSITAIEKLRTKQRPLLMSTTGAVNGGTTDPFFYYRNDYTGILFNDTVFTPFFCGAAGTGMMNHTAEYIDVHNFWPLYKEFSEMVSSLKVDKQHFKFETYRRKYYTMLVMRGRTTTLVYIRSLYDNWERMLRDDQRLIVRRGIRIQNFGGVRAKVYPLYGESMPEELTVKNDEFWLPPFAHGMFLRIR